MAVAGAIWGSFCFYAAAKMGKTIIKMLRK